MTISVHIEITEQFLEKCGTGTLMAAAYSNGALPDHVTLVFPQTSLGFRRRNGGPKLYIMPEFVPYCLLMDVLELVERGCRVVLEVSQEPECP